MEELLNMMARDEIEPPISGAEYPDETVCELARPPIRGLHPGQKRD